MRLPALVERGLHRLIRTKGADSGAGKPAHAIRTGLCLCGTVSVKDAVGWASLPLPCGR